MQTIHLEGRKFGGTAWLIRDTLKEIVKVEFVNDKNSVCAITQSNHQIIILGIYASLEKENFKDELAVMSAKLDMVKNKHKIMIIGDFNSNIYRSHKHENNIQTRCANILTNINKNKYPNDGILSKWINKLNLTTIDHLYMQNIQTTYRNISHIDHILIHNAMQWNNIVQVNIIKYNTVSTTHWDMDNLSDHRPVEVTMTIETPKYAITQVQTNKPKDKIKWSDDNKNIFRLETIRVANELNIIKECNSRNNDELSKNLAASNVYKKIHEILQASENNILKQQKDEKTSNPFYHKSKYRWTGELSIIAKMRRFHANQKRLCPEDIDKDQVICQYYRRDFRQQQAITNNAKLDNHAKELNKKYKHNMNNFWKIIKNTKRTDIKVNIEISILTQHYKMFFNTNNLASNQVYLSKIIENNNKKIEEIIKENAKYYVTTDEINKAIDSLKIGKATGYTNLQNELVKYAERTWITKSIAFVINSFINNHAIDNDANIGMIKPIIKSATNPSNEISNIRPITLSDPFAIILEKIILNELERKQQINKLQFGFTANSSTMHAVFVLKEVILQNLKNKTPVFVLFLDFSAAFDKVNKDLLMNELAGNINNKIWMLIYNYMKAAKLCVRNNDQTSEFFEATRSVKQGGPASPKLFNIYINKLLNEIVQSKLTVTLYDIDCGILGYADDTTALCNTAQKMAKVIKIIEDFCTKYEIKINASKTHWMLFNKSKKSTATFKIYGEEITRVDKFKFLGVWIEENMGSEEHLKVRCHKSMTNSFVLNKVGLNRHSMKREIKSFLYRTYCRSTLIYGMEMLSTNKKGLEYIKREEGKILKHINGVGKYSSTSKLQAALEIESFVTLLKKKKLNFIQILLNNDLTREILMRQIANISNLHENSLIKEIISEYLNIEISQINNINDLSDRIENELNTLAEDTAEPDEAELNCIRYLLEKRNHDNNKILNELLRYNNVDT
jgi:hypothetical protein